MNEVTVLSTAGELAGRAAGHGVLVARRAVVATTRSATTLAVRAGQASARAVRARRAREIRLPSRDAVRRDLAAAIAPTRRRRWPWAVGVLGVLAAAAVLALRRRPVAAPPAPAPPRVQDVHVDAVTGTDPGLTTPEP